MENCSNPKAAVVVLGFIELMVLGHYLIIGMLIYVIFEHITREPRPSSYHLATLNKLLSVSVEDRKEKLLDVSVDLCISERDPRKEYIGRYIRFPGLGDHAEVERHYLKMELRNFEEGLKKRVTELAQWEKTV